MPKDNRSVTFRCVALLVIWVLTTAIVFGPRSAALTDASVVETYSPVAPVGALLHAVRVNLKVVDEWLGDGDFDSAAETADRVKLLLTFCDFQSRDGSWRDRVAILRSQCDQLIGSAKGKDAAACAEASRGCQAALASLERDRPDGDKANGGDFKPPSSVRPLMKLLDGTYTDAKLAKSLDELTAMAYTIAEAANVAQYARTDGDWRVRAGDARGAALKVATLKADTDLKVARQELKNVYERCQACHKAFRR